MDTLEVTASGVDEARTIGAEKLGVEPNQIEAEVLEERDGLFGVKKVRVKLTVTGRAAAQVEAPPAPEPVEKPPLLDEAEPPEEDRRESDRRASEEGRDPDRRRRDRRSTEKEEPVPPPEPKKEAGAAGDAADVVATQEDADDLLAVLTDIADAGGFDVEVSLDSLQGKYVNLAIKGADAGNLVGENGQTLNALQFYMNVVAMRQLDNGVRVVLDSDGYREQRSDSLESLAKEVAEMVLKRGEEAVLDPLPAFERRVIHNVLSDVDGVTTYSEGEEPDRCVVIAPAD